MPSITYPKIAVVVPAWNRPHLWPRSMRSVLTQSIPTVLVIADDGTEISARGIATDLAKEFGKDRVIYVKTKGNQGPPAACNLGVKNTNADFVAILSDDDEYLPAAVEQMSAPLVEHNDVDFVLANVHSIHTEGDKVVRDHVYKPNAPSGVPRDFVEDLLAHRVKMEGFMIRRSSMIAAGNLDQALLSSDTTDLMIRMCLRGGKGYYLDQVVARKYTRLLEPHAGSIDKKILGRDLLLKKHYTFLKKHPLILSKYYYELASLKRVYGDIKGAQSAFFKAWIYNKSNLGALIRATGLLFGMRVYLFFKGLLNRKSKKLQSTEQIDEQAEV